MVDSRLIMILIKIRITYGAEYWEILTCVLDSARKYSKMVITEQFKTDV